MIPPEPPHAVTQYALDVIASRTVAGVLVRKACERHIRDLADGPARGLTFDVAAADRAISFFPHLRHFEGELGPVPPLKPLGAPVILEPWQKFVIGSAFGWKRQNGARRFRRVYLEVAKKNGKTLMAAGIGLLLAFFDGEPGAQVYVVATKRDQAKICWGAGLQMVNTNPELKKRLETLALTITDLKTASFFRPLGRDSDTGEQGVNAHGAIIDELHVLEERDTVENLETATSARRQPMVVKITTAGKKRESVWSEERADALAVVEGRATDDSMLVLIYTLDDTRTESYGSSRALQWMIQSCTCRPGDIASTRPSAPSIPSDHRSASDSATAATAALSENGIRRSAESRTSTGADGRTSTESRSELPSAAGRPETRDGNSNEIGSSSSGYQPPNMTNASPSRTADAPSAANDQTGSASTTITTQEPFEDFSVASATAPSASWEIVKKAYSAHSTTCDVRKAELLDDGLRVSIQGDDPFDEAVWPKANPNLGVSVEIEGLREQAEIARRSPGKLAAYLQLRMNIPTAISTRAINIDEWDANAEDSQIAEGAACFAGLDLASTLDLTALVLVSKDEDGVYDLVCRFWCPEPGIQERSRLDGVPYTDWVRDGFLTATPARTTDYAFIREEIKQLATKYFISEIAYDKWNALQLVLELEQDGAACIAIPQTHAGLAPAWRELEKLILERKLRHGGNPILRWMAGNVEVETDGAGNQKPSKRLSTERIDGMVALNMAFARWLANGEIGVWTAA